MRGIKLSSYFVTVSYLYKIYCKGCNTYQTVWRNFRKFTSITGLGSLKKILRLKSLNIDFAKYFHSTCAKQYSVHLTMSALGTYLVTILDKEIVCLEIQNTFTLSFMPSTNCLRVEARNSLT